MIYATHLSYHFVYQRAISEMEKTLFIFLINVLISNARNRPSSGQPLDKSINLILDVERRIVDIDRRIEDIEEQVADIEIDIQNTPPSSRNTRFFDMNRPSSKVPKGLEYRVHPRPNAGVDDKFSTCQTEACLKASDDTLALMNTSVDPCEDFYQYSCGGFNQVTYKFDLNCI